MPSSEPKKALPDGIAAAKAKLVQNANGLILCYDCAIYAADQITKRHPETVIPLFGPDELQKIAVALWISLERSGLIVGLPAGRLPDQTRTEPAKRPQPPPDEHQPEPPEEML